MKCHGKIHLSSMACSTFSTCLPQLVTASHAAGVETMPLATRWRFFAPTLQGLAIRFGYLIREFASPLFGYFLKGVCFSSDWLFFKGSLLLHAWLFDKGICFSTFDKNSNWQRNCKLDTDRQGPVNWSGHKQVQTWKHKQAKTWKHKQARAWKYYKKQGAERTDLHHSSRFSGLKPLYNLTASM